MSVGGPRRHSRSMDEVDEDGNVLWHGVKLGELWKTDMQVAINDSNRRGDASFTIRAGKAGTTQPYQQPIPIDFARYHKNLFMETVTLEVPTGLTWSTVMRPSNQVVRFGKGWRQFSVENHLQEGYQLLFTLRGRFYFRVQFFDHLGKRRTSYPPLPGSEPVAETQNQISSQPDCQPAVDAGQASHRHGSAAQTSALAVPVMGTTSNSAIPLDFDSEDFIRRQYGPEVAGPEASLPHKHLRVSNSDPRNDSEESETEDEDTEELTKDSEYVLLDSDNDEVPYRHTPATKLPLVKSERKVLTLNELLLRNKKISRDCHQTTPTHTQYTNSSSDDEPPPIIRTKVTVKRQSPVAGYYHKDGESSGRSSPAVRLLQQQGCMRFSNLVSKCRRRDVSNRERHLVREAAKQFASKLGNEKFLVVMQDVQVYQGFHLTIPQKILEVTGTERAPKVEVCLVDREQVQYKTHWTQENYYNPPLLDFDAWAKFAVDHALEEGDVCVFQLLPQLPQSKPSVSMPTFVFCVHIFRVVETYDFSDVMDDIKSLRSTTRRSLA